MMPTDLSETINNTTPPSFQSRPAPREGVLVQTPFFYPDGSPVEVSVIESDGGFVVTNHGEALRWLGMQRVRKGLSCRQNRLVDEVCRALEVRQDCGRLVSRCNDASELGKAIHRVGQAVVRVSDVWFTIPLSDTTTDASPHTRSRSLWQPRWPWFWVLFYALCAGAAAIALHSKTNGMPSILQIIGVIITLTSLWATIRIRTSQTGHTCLWRKSFDFMTATGTALIITGIYWGAVGKFEPIWVVGMGAAVLVAWGIVLFGFGRGLR